MKEMKTSKGENEGFELRRLQRVKKKLRRLICLCCSAPYDDVSCFRGFSNTENGFKCLDRSALEDSCLTVPSPSPPAIFFMFFAFLSLYHTSKPFQTHALPKFQCSRGQ